MIIRRVETKRSWPRKTPQMCMELAGTSATHNHIRVVRECTDKTGRLRCEVGHSRTRCPGITMQEESANGRLRPNIHTRAIVDPIRTQHPLGSDVISVLS